MDGERVGTAMSTGPARGGRAAAALLLALLIASCRGVPGPAPDPDALAPLPGGEIVKTHGGGYWVEFSSWPRPVPLGEMFDVDVRVHDGSRDRAALDESSLCEDVELAVDASMPAHRHGMNYAPAVLRLAPGVFRAEGLLFHMPGHWELYFDITAAGRTERAQVDVELE